MDKLELDRLKNTPTVRTEVSKDFNEFSQVVADNYQKKLRMSHTKSQLEAWSPNFYSQAQEGDTLVYWVWDAGFLRYADGYEIVRDGQVVANLPCMVS